MVERIDHRLVATGPVRVVVEGNNPIGFWMEVGDKITITDWRELDPKLRPTVTFQPAPIEDYTK